MVPSGTGETVVSLGGTTLPLPVVTVLGPQNDAFKCAAIPAFRMFGDVSVSNRSKIHAKNRKMTP